MVLNLYSVSINKILARKFMSVKFHMIQIPCKKCKHSEVNNLVGKCSQKVIDCKKTIKQMVSVVRVQNFRIKVWKIQSCRMFGNENR